MPKEKRNVNEKTNVKKKPHIVLGLVIVILFIRIVILAAILVSSLEDSSQPVVGSRYQNELDPAITEENITSLENALVFDGTDSIQVNFKTARVAILIDTNDDMSADSINNLIQQAYAKVNEVLPIETYFTNRSDGENYVKMYDLQIDAYNVISGDNQIHYVLTKTGAQDEPLLELVSSPKNEEVANDVQNQNANEGE
jgi:flagellar basal body-associated protein FliL